MQPENLQNSDFNNGRKQQIIMNEHPPQSEWSMLYFTMSVAWVLLILSFSGLIYFIVSMFYPNQQLL